MTTFQQAAAAHSQQQLIAPGVADPHLWQEECMAVETQIATSKFQVLNDWRPDIQKLCQLNEKLLAETGTINQQLQVVADQLEKQIQMLQQHEAFLNQQISQFSGKLIESSRRHGMLTTESQQLQQEIQNLTDQLGDLTERCKRAKQEMHAESTRINDSSAVTYAKQALAQLTAEIRELNLRIILAQQRLFVSDQR